jgi:hypothetical protein
VFKVRGAVSRVKDLPKYLTTNSYSFTPEEVGITTLPRSIFVPSIIAVSGSTPAIIIGSAMTASSVAEWGVPLIAAAVAGYSAPFGMRATRQKKLRKEVSEGLTALLPQLILEGAPVVTETHAATLLKGKAVEFRLSTGSTVAIRLGDRLKGDIGEKTAGTVYLVPGTRGTAEFDVLVEGISAKNPDVSKALREASVRNSVKAVQDMERPAITAPAPARNYLLNLRDKVQRPNP